MRTKSSPPARHLLFLSFVFALGFVGPAQSQGWTQYHNQRFGAVADVPSGFAPMGPEAANSDGLIFRAREGNALLTIFGANVPGGDFARFVEKAMAHDHDYSGWVVRGKTLTPSWAEYSGSHGARQLRVRFLQTCGGRHAVGVKLEYNGTMDNLVARVFRSLHAEATKGCPAQ